MHYQRGSNYPIINVQRAVVRVTPVRVTIAYSDNICNPRLTFHMIEMMLIESVVYINTFADPL